MYLRQPDSATGDRWSHCGDLDNDMSVSHPSGGSIDSGTTLF